MSTSMPCRLVRWAVLALAGCATNGEITTTHDPFNGDQRGFALYLDSGHYTAVGMSEAKDKFLLQVLVVQRSESHLVGRAGDRGQFLVGGEKLELVSANAAKPVANATDLDVFTQWMALFSLTRAQAVRFAQAPHSAVKVWIGDQWFQLELTPSESNKFQGNLRTMTSARTPAEPGHRPRRAARLAGQPHHGILLA